jgi:hypothetical protein
MKAVMVTKVNLQGLASSNARMSCPGPTKNDIMLAIEEIGYKYLAGACMMSRNTHQYRLDIASLAQNPHASRV